MLSYDEKYIIASALNEMRPAAYDCLRRLMQAIVDDVPTLSADLDEDLHFLFRNPRGEK